VTIDNSILELPEIKTR